MSTTSPHASPSNPPTTTTTTTTDPTSFTLDDPTDTDALSSYARTMHAHTLSQLHLLTRANTRRTAAPASKEDAQPVSAIGVLREESSVGSVDSAP